MKPDMKIFDSMKTFYRIAAVAAMTIVTLASCGNAGAQESKKKEGNTVIELTSEEFSDKVYDINAERLEYLGSKPAIVDFTASWCGPCRRISPILEELAAEYKGEVVIYKVDVDKCRDIAAAFGISSIPAILYIPVNGEPSMTIGSRNKTKFQEEIKTILLEK